MAAFAKKAVYGMMRLGGMYQYARYAHRNQAVILTYHGVLQNGSDSYVNRNCVNADTFEQQMRWLKRHYRVLSLSRLVHGLQGKEPLPKYAAAVTFDDGFRNNYSIAFPILVRLDLPATIFITTDYIGTKDGQLWTEKVDALIHSATIRRLQIQMNGSFMEFEVASPKAKEIASDRIRAFLKKLNPAERSRHIDSLERQVDHRVPFIEEMDERYAFLDWDEIRTMADYGVEIGSHTQSHAIVSTLGSDELERELQHSKAKIEAELQRPCTLFSYPNGSEKDFTRRDQDMLAALGYCAACSQIDGFNAAGENPYALKRTNIVRWQNFSFFQAKVTGVWAKLKGVMN